MFPLPSAIPPPIPYPLDIGVGVVGSLLVLFCFAAAAIIVDAAASWHHNRSARVCEGRSVRLPETDRTPKPEERSMAA